MIPIPSEQLYHPVRVCDDCFSILDAKQKPNHWTADEPERGQKHAPAHQETEIQPQSDDHASISGQVTPPPP